MMKIIRLLVVVALVGWMAGTAMAADKAPSKVASAGQIDYLIGPGDVLEISVWKEEALTKNLIVRPDGKISFPLIGEVVAAGKTVAHLKKEMETRLVRFVPDPVLSVGVQQVNSLMIYVIGRVNNPGRFVLNANINVLQALAMAGGLDSFAKRDQVKIFRNVRGKVLIYTFDYDDVSAGKNLRQNITLARGDVVVAR
jgi:polysaccharide export outer membrane protein